MLGVSAIFLQLIINGLLMGSVYSLVAVGLSLIFGIVGLINFAYSDFMVIAMFACFWMWDLFNWDPLMSLPVALLICVLLGAFTYLFIVKRALQGPKLAQTLSTYAFGIFLRNALVFLFSQNYRMIREPLLSGQFNVGSLNIDIAKLFAAILSIIATSLLWTYLSKSKGGLALRATAIDKVAGTLMGINTNKMFLRAFVIGSACVAVAGTALSHFYYVFPYLGVNFSSITFATIALGGFGSLPGALIAGLIIGMVESLAGFYLDASLKYAVVFLLYILVVVVRPKGLKGW